MGKHGDHAVVIGASMGGLLAARVLADAFDQVTILEHDELPARTQDRKGVPQGRHGHGLHPAGLQVLEDLFPGFTAEAAADGAPVFASTTIRGVVAGHPMRRADVGAPLLSTSRPFLEGLVRRRVAGLDGVSIVDGCDVVGPVHPGGNRITGVRVLRRRDGSAEEVLDADLVVDATGRAGQALRWLDELGFPRPAQEEVHVGVAYATRHVRLPAGALGPDRIVVVGPRPGHLRGMYLAEQEDGWSILTVFGYRGNEPAATPTGSWRSCVPSRRQTSPPPSSRPSRSLTSSPTGCRPACAGATSGSAGSRKGSWCLVTRSAASTRSTARA